MQAAATGGPFSGNASGSIGNSSQMVSADFSADTYQVKLGSHTTVTFNDFFMKAVGSADQKVRVDAFDDPR